MRGDALDEAIQTDIEQGLIPFFVRIITSDVKVPRPAWSRDHFFGLGLGLMRVSVSGLIRVGLVVSKRSFAFLIN